MTKYFICFPSDVCGATLPMLFVPGEISVSIIYHTVLLYISLSLCACSISVGVSISVCVCARACTRACVRVCVRACVCVHVCACMCTCLFYTIKFNNTTERVLSWYAPKLVKQHGKTKRHVWDHLINRLTESFWVVLSWQLAHPRRLWSTRQTGLSAKGQSRRGGRDTSENQNTKTLFFSFFLL